MRIIIAGDGKVGLALTRLLSQEGHDLVTIDSNRAVLERDMQQFDVMTVVGNCATMATLNEAKVQQAEVLIAATSADEINLLCCLTARKMNPTLHTIARVRSPEYREQLYMMRGEFGLSLIINPEREAAKEIFRLLQLPGFLKRETFAKGRVEIVELRVLERSPLENVILNHLPHVLGCKVLVCAVIRDGHALIPSGDTMLRRGDHIYVTAPVTVLSYLMKRLGITQKKIRHAMLIGGGRMGYYLARQLLATGMDVKIIESDAKRCEELSQLLPEATILHGDGTDQRLLQEEGIEHMDAIAALTGIDEENIIISLFAGRTTRAKVITKVNRSSYEPLVASLSLDSVFYPRNICADNVVRYVRAMQNSDAYASMETLCKIVSNKVEAMEFRVTASADFCGIPLQDLHLKDGLLIGCISRGGKTITPRGSDTIEVGDSVIVVAAHSGLRSLNDIFTTRR